MSKNREAIYLDELIMKIRENKEVGEIMGNTMIEIAKSCKTVQKEEMPHYKQIGRDEVMAKLTEGKEVFCVILKSKKYDTEVYRLQMWHINAILDMINRVEDAVFYERIEESEEPE
ncbi:MAG: hypothetical protein K2N51_20495 [Lachnospiraceae bacterium]|nr:hypothetical protein [Lachnospiraceae bacterium]